MENYYKGDNEELGEDLNTRNIPIQSLPANFDWLLVRGPTKADKVTPFIVQSLQREGAIVVAGTGTAVGKVADIFRKIKKIVRDFYFVAKFTHRFVREYWEPKLDGLDRLVVTRQIPTVHLLLSKADLDHQEDGYMSVGGIAPPDHLWPASLAKMPRGGGEKQGGNNNRRRSGKGPKDENPKGSNGAPGDKPPPRNRNRNGKQSSNDKAKEAKQPAAEKGDKQGDGQPDDKPRPERSRNNANRRSDKANNNNSNNEKPRGGDTHKQHEKKAEKSENAGDKQQGRIGGKTERPLSDNNADKKSSVREAKSGVGNATNKNVEAS